MRCRAAASADGMMLPGLKLTKPGMFVTGTDTGVGKTVVCCAVAASLKRWGRVGVCKPIATGCENIGGQLVSEDAVALQRFAGGGWPMERVNPVRFEAPVAPAVAAEQTGRVIDFDAIGESLTALDREADVMIVEGIGGLLVPIDPCDANRTVLDLIVTIGYPVVVVTRAGLGTLNHTAMTVKLLRQTGCRVAGLVVNGFVEDVAARDRDVATADVSMVENRRWLRMMTGCEVLATLPQCSPGTIVAHEGRIDAAVLDAAGQCHWPNVTDSSRCAGVGESGDESGGGESGDAI